MTNFNNYKGTTSTAPCKNCPYRKVNENGKVCEKDCAKWFSYKLELKLVKQEIQKEKEYKEQVKLNELCVS